MGKRTSSGRGQRRGTGMQTGGLARPSARGTRAVVLLALAGVACGGRTGTLDDTADESESGIPRAAETDGGFSPSAEDGSGQDDASRVPTALDGGTSSKSDAGAPPLRDPGTLSPEGSGLGIAPDAAVEVESDAPADAGPNAGTNTGTSAGTDSATSPEVGVSTEPDDDGGTSVGIDSGGAAEDDAGSQTDDASADVGIDTSTDAEADAGNESDDDADPSALCGGSRCVDDGDVCNGVAFCDPDTNRCIEEPPPLCDDGVFCNGAETCDGVRGCVPGQPVGCSGDHGTCSESERACLCTPPWVGADCSVAFQIFPHFGQVQSIAEEGNVLWISTSSGIWALDHGGTPADPTDDRSVVFTPADGLSGHDVSQIAIDEAGGKWIVVALSDPPLNYLDDRGTPFEKGDDAWVGYGNDQDPPVTAVTKVVLDATGAKWLVDNQHGLALFDDGGTPFELSDDVWLSVGGLDDIDSGDASDLVVDGNGGVWLATRYDGLHGYDNASGLSSSFTMDNSGLPQSRILSAAVQGGGGLWLATGDDGGRTVSNESLAYLGYGGTITDSADDRWMAFPGEGRLDYVQTLAVDAAGVTWIGDRANGITRLDDGQTPFDTSDDEWTPIAHDVGWVSAITPRSASDLWFGGQDGLWYLDHGGNATTSDDILVVLEPPPGPGDVSIYGMAADTDGGRWFVTTRGASYLHDAGTPLDRSDDRWVHFDRHDQSGLDDVRGLVKAPNGLAYFFNSTRDGASLLSLDDGETPFDKTDDRWVVHSGAVSGLFDVRVIAADSDATLVVTQNSQSTRGACLDDAGTPADGSDDFLVDVFEFGHTPLVEVVAVDASGGRWVSLVGIGLQYWDQSGTPCEPSDDVWTEVALAHIGQTSISRGASDPVGGLWLTLQDGTVAYFDPSGTPSDPNDDRWVFFGTDDGLPETALALEVSVGAPGIVWIQAGRAMLRLTTAGTPFDKSDDTWAVVPQVGELPTFESVREIAADADGGVWVASTAPPVSLVYLTLGAAP